MTASTDLHASPAPPETLPELRSLALAIAQGKSIVTLGSKAAEALSRILEMGGDPVMLSITSLAENLSVNRSTLARLAHSLGYFGAFAGPSAFYSEHAKAALEASARPAEARSALRDRDRMIERLGIELPISVGTERA